MTTTAAATWNVDPRIRLSPSGNPCSWCARDHGVELDSEITTGICSVHTDRMRDGVARRVQAAQAIPLASAALCLECEVVFDVERRTCPRCARDSFVLLSTILNRSDSGGPDARS